MTVVAEETSASRTMNTQSINRELSTQQDDRQAALHGELSLYASQRLAPGSPDLDWKQELAKLGYYGQLEAAFLEKEREKIASWARKAPSTPAAFVEWFETLREDGPGQFDPFFEWLAHESNYQQMRWFIRQEVVGEAGFDDLIALTQLQMPTLVKLEMARNYWDEMGRGRKMSMHGPILDALAQKLQVHDACLGETTWQAQALGNMLVGLAANRRFAYHSVGALGAVELTAPTRTVKVEAALERLGLSIKERWYFRLHTTVDIVHSKDWNEHVLYNLVAEDARRARWIAEGALMRLNAGARCFDRYRQHFGLPAIGAEVRFLPCS